MRYVSLLMNYIEQEYDNIPDYVTPEMDEHFRECYEREEPIPNAARCRHPGPVRWVKAGRWRG